MIGSKHTSSQTGGVTQIIPVFTLASWQIRQTWRLLLVAALGMVAAVVLVCAVPLYSRVALTAGLRTLVSSSEINSSIIVHGAPTRSGLEESVAQLDQTVQYNLSDQVSEADPLHMTMQGPGAQTPGLPIYPTKTEPQTPTELTMVRNQKFGQAAPQLQLHGYSESQLASRLTLIEGRLPQIHPDVIEVVMTSETMKCPYKTYKAILDKPCAQALKVGDIITVSSPFSIIDNNPNGKTPPKLLPWKIQVVGIIKLNQASDPYWHGVTFENGSVDQFDRDNQINNLSLALTTSESLIANIDTASIPGQSANPIPNPNGPILQFNGGTDLYWYYPLKVSALTADRLSSLIEGIYNVETEARNNPIAIQIDQVITPNDTLRQYESRMELSQIPVNMLLILIVGMVLLFIAIAINLLVERQSDVVAILRSRGASRRQIFAVFTAQSFFLAVVVLLIGPLLAIPVATLMVKQIFSISDMGALSLITSDPIAAAWDVRWYALAAIGATLLVTLFTLFQATRFDVLALRREAARPTRPNIWHRFYLDAVLGLLALIGYGYTIYALRTGTLDSRTRIELLSPLVLLSSMLILLSALLVFLRYFPRMVQWAAHVASRYNSAAPMLALAQLSRTPQQAQRIILLLTLTTALTIFSLIFSASQAQRIVDVVNYQVGADLSGWIPNSSVYVGDTTTNTNALQTLAEPYRKIPGITSASLGGISTVKSLSYQIALKAVDTDTFAKTVLWSPQYSTTSIDTLMKQLSENRKQSLQDNIVPAIIDTDTWNALNLREGQTFAIQPTNKIQITFRATAKVAYIPTTNLTSSANEIKIGGLLVDYLSYSAAYKKATQEAIVPNYVWLRTDPQKNSVEIRTALNKLLDTQTILFDRKNFISTMEQDPVMLNIMGAFAIGTVTPLLLALLGSFLVSWLNARNRILSFSLLRALGTSPRQIAFVLSWEQCFIYLIMFALGIFSGIVLSGMVLPSLVMTSVFTSTSNGSINSDPSLLNSFPATQMIFPSSLYLVICLLIAICLGALLLMVRIISRPSVSQALRLNAD